MKAQLISELRKVRSTRTSLLLGLGVVAICVLAAVSVSGQSAVEYAKPLREQQFFFLATFSKVLLVILGIRLATDEFRFGTVLPTFTFTPTRRTVLAAKVAAGALVGLVVSVIAYAALFGTAAVMFSGNGHELVLGGQGAQLIAGSIFAGMLWTVIGVGIGSIVRNQVTAVTGTLIWVMAAEQIVSSKLGVLGDFTPVSAGFGVVLADTGKHALMSGAALVGWTVAFAVLGAMTLRSRDLT
jgi:ABC-type transport system involved in multi-copper enzyme maturation permease subunit